MVACMHYATTEEGLNPPLQHIFENEAFVPIHLYTVTRPYTEFRHTDRMEADQTVRGGENKFSIWSGNFLPQIPKFSVIKGNFQFFPAKKVRIQNHIQQYVALTLSSTPRPRLPCKYRYKIYNNLKK
jgi:hypothetical protein